MDRTGKQLCVMDWGFGITEDRGDQQPGTDVTGGSPQPVSLLHVLSKRQKIPNLQQLAAFLFPPVKRRKPKVAAVPPKFQPTQNLPPVGLCKENNRKIIKLN